MKEKPSIEEAQASRLERARQLLQQPESLKPREASFLQQTTAIAGKVAKDLVGMYFYGSPPAPLSTEETVAAGWYDHTKSLYDEHGETTDPKLTAKVDKAVNLALESFQGKDVGFNGRVVILDTEVVKGTAEADGSFVISRSLVEKLTDEELLFVAAHEMGHHKEQHNSERLAFEKAIAESKAEGESWKTDYLKTKMTDFYQKAEDEADDYGIRALQFHGLGKEHALSFFLRNTEATGLDAEASDTHPSDLARAWNIATYPNA